MGVKQEKAFMTMNEVSGCSVFNVPVSTFHHFPTLKILSSLVLAVMLLSFNACTPDLSDDQIPYQSFPVIQINLNLPEYNSLRTVGGYKYIEGGMRGIILYHQNQSSYIAYERNCSYQPNSACATVGVHSSTLYLVDDCCGSTFDFATGQPTGGVAWRPLRQYETILSGSTLTVTDAIVE
jgi:hypothetical protein